MYNQYEGYLKLTVEEYNALMIAIDNLEFYSNSIKDVVTNNLAKSLKGIISQRIKLEKVCGEVAELVY